MNFKALKTKLLIGSGLSHLITRTFPNLRSQCLNASLLDPKKGPDMAVKTKRYLLSFRPADKKKAPNGQKHLWGIKELGGSSLVLFLTNHFYIREKTKGGSISRLMFPFLFWPWVAFFGGGEEEAKSSGRNSKEMAAKKEAKARKRAQEDINSPLYFFSSSSSSSPEPFSVLFPPNKGSGEKNQVHLTNHLCDFLAKKEELCQLGKRGTGRKLKLK